jgi:hypothetical protein
MHPGFSWLYLTGILKFFIFNSYGLEAGFVKFYSQVHGFMTGINKMKEARMEVIIINTFVL